MKTLIKALIFSLVLATSTSAMALMVTVSPVEIFNAPGVAAVGPGLQAAIASRVSGEGYEVTTDGSASGDWVLRTTVTRLGKLFSVDGVLTDTSGEYKAVRSYETANSEEELMEAISRMSEGFKARLGEISIGMAPPRPQPGTARVAGPRPAVPLLATYEQFAEIEGKVSSLILSDTTGDGVEEIIVLIEKELAAYTVADNGLTLLWKATLEVSFKPLIATAGDIDKDGLVEVMVAGSIDNEAFSRCYTLKAGGVVPKGETKRAFLKIMTHPKSGVIVTGIPTWGGSKVFRTRLFQYDWDGESFVKGEKIPTPDAIVPVNVGWVQTGKNDKANLVVIEPSGGVRIYDEELDKLFESEDKFGGGVNYFQGEMLNQVTGDEGSTHEVGPLIIQREDIIYIQDNIEGSVWKGKSGSHDSGAMRALLWDGLGLRVVGSSPKFKSPIITTAIDKEGKRLFAVLLKSKGFWTTKFTSQVLVFQL